MKSDESSSISLKRLQTLTDSFFALALILLVVFIEKPPQDMKPTEEAIRNYLSGQLDVVTAYLVTFINIAFYWFFSHNQSKYLRRSDGVHTWLTIITLMFVGLLPFSNSLTVAFPASLTVNIFYSCVVFLVGLLFCLDWFHAAGKDRLIDRSLNADRIDQLSVESLVQPAAALFSLGGAFIGTLWWQVPYLLVPVATFAVSTLWARKKARQGRIREPE
jgi:uncharacterized membrane protein